MIGQKHFGLELQKKNFARHGVCDGKSRIKRTFILHCFQEILEKMNFPQKLDSGQFLAFKVP